MKDRIEKVFRYYSISASQFADEIGVQRSNISHILSERNKPSLDIVQKILYRFKDINPEWLITGKGEMLRQATTQSLFSTIVEPKPDASTPVIPPPESVIPTILQAPTELTRSRGDMKIEEKIIPEPLETTQKEAVQDIMSTQNEDEIEKIVIFYKNKTFTSYTPRKV
jgi:DNA-binding XRE family transcriptional regulator